MEQAPVARSGFERVGDLTQLHFVLGSEVELEDIIPGPFFWLIHDAVIDDLYIGAASEDKRALFPRLVVVVVIDGVVGEAQSLGGDGEDQRHIEGVKDVVLDAHVAVVVVLLALEIRNLRENRDDRIGELET